MGLLLSLVISTAGIGTAAFQANAKVHSYNVTSQAISDSALQFTRDARAAKAIDVLAQDAQGNDNSDGHEFALLYQNVDGSLKLTRYAKSGSAWTRCVQTSPTSACTQDGAPQSNISVMSAVVITTPELADAASPYYTPALSTDPSHAPIDVELPTQWAGMRSGNHIVEVRIANAVNDLTVDLIPGSAITSNLTEISGTYAPPAANSCTFVSGYTGSATIGWTPTNTTDIWQWFQAAPSCSNAPTPPPVAVTTSYVANCPATFYTPVTGSATWQQQPQPDATTPPPTTVVTGYANDDPLEPITQAFAWNQGPCPNPTLPPTLPVVPTPVPTVAPTAAPMCPPGYYGAPPNCHLAPPDQLETHYNVTGQCQTGFDENVYDCSVTGGDALQLIAPVDGEYDINVTATVSTLANNLFPISVDADVTMIFAVWKIGQPGYVYIDYSYISQNSCPGPSFACFGNPVTSEFRGNLAAGTYGYGISFSCDTAFVPNDPYFCGYFNGGGGRPLNSTYQVVFDAAYGFRYPF